MNSQSDSQQKLNLMYGDLTGANARYSTILIFIRLALIGMGLSILGSSTGFFYDFQMLVPDYAIPLSALFALTLEFARVGAAKGLFAFKQFEIKAGFGAAIIIITILATVLHVRGMDSMVIVKTNDAIKEVLHHNQKIEMMKQNRADALLSSTMEAQQAVLSNGTKYDDRLMIKSARESMELIGTLSQQQKITDTQAQYLVAQKSQAETIAKIGYILLPMIEVFAIISLLVSYLKIHAVSDGVKDIVDTHHVLSAAKASETVYQPTRPSLEDRMLEKVKRRIIGSFIDIEEVEPDSENDPKLKVEQTPKVVHTADPKTDPKPTQNLNDTTSESIGKEEGFKEQETQRESEQFRINLMTYPNTYNEIIKTMFDYGRIKQGQFLVEKKQVLKALTIGKRDYETVAESLVKHKHIMFLTGKGYLALSELENEVKVS